MEMGFGIANDTGTIYNYLKEFLPTPNPYMKEMEEYHNRNQTYNRSENRRSQSTT